MLLRLLDGKILEPLPLSLLGEYTYTCTCRKHMHYVHVHVHAHAKRGIVHGKCAADFCAKAHLLFYLQYTHVHVAHTHVHVHVHAQGWIQGVVLGVPPRSFKIGNHYYNRT